MRWVWQDKAVRRGAESAEVRSEEGKDVSDVPDPLIDPEGYALWLEANTEECTACGGTGEWVDDEDEIRVCMRCDGFGFLDPIVGDDES